MDAGAAGCSVFVALLFTGAGALKLLYPATFKSTLRALLGRRIASLPPVVATTACAVSLVELAIAAGLLLGRGFIQQAAAAGATILCVGFVLAIRAAIRKGVSCGCFGRLSKTPAGLVELTRAGYLGLASLTILVDTAYSTPASLASPETVGVASAVGLGAVFAMRAARWLARKPGETVVPATLHGQLLTGADGVGSTGGPRASRRLFLKAGGLALGGLVGATGNVFGAPRLVAADYAPQGGRQRTAAGTFEERVAQLRLDPPMRFVASRDLTAAELNAWSSQMQSSVQPTRLRNLFERISGPVVWSDSSGVMLTAQLTGGPVFDVPVLAITAPMIGRRVPQTIVWYPQLPASGAIFELAFGLGPDRFAAAAENKVFQRTFASPNCVDDCYTAYQNCETGSITGAGICILFAQAAPPPFDFLGSEACGAWGAESYIGCDDTYNACLDGCGTAAGGGAGCNTQSCWICWSANYGSWSACWTCGPTYIPRTCDQFCINTPDSDPNNPPTCSYGNTGCLVCGQTYEGTYVDCNCA